MLKKILNFLKETKIEMAKVDWPNKKATTAMTLTVIGISLGVAIFLGGLDFIFSTILTKFII